MNPNHKHAYPTAARRAFQVLVQLGTLALLFLSSPGLTASSKDTGNIQQTLEQRQRDVRAHEQILKGLTEQERKLFGNLQQVENRLRTSTEEISELETQLVFLHQKENVMQQEYREIEQARSQTGLELGGLLAVLWPMHLQGVEHNLQTLTSWDEADRQFQWLSRIYGLVQERIDRLQRQERELAQGQTRLEHSRVEIREHIRRINTRKDELLAQKLDFLRRVQEVRAQKVTAEDQVKEILESITELNYQLQALTTKSFTNLRGHMPWPAQGRVVERFHPQADPPHRGISVQTEENEAVRSISWGKVVHSNVLRGYGHVVIVYHGEDYYSLYMFLNSAQVAVGQEVEKNDVIGKAGFYPKVDGPGLYFELRFHQNPVNPDNWLVAK